MPFVKFSSESLMNSEVRIESIFILEYLPFAPENHVKVYLYGLALCHDSAGADNSVERLAAMLSLDVSAVINAYAYWENEGLVKIRALEPPEIEYLPVKGAARKIKKFKPEKYAGFNKQLEASLPDRPILPNEFNEYYGIMETLHIEIEAMLEIVHYCVRLKGANIGYQYILTVARNLAREGLTSYDAVHERLTELSDRLPETAAVFKILGLKRAPDFDDRQLYAKWVKTLGFKQPDILHAARKCKSGGVKRLDSLLSRYYENKVMERGEMDAFDAARDRLYALSRAVNKILGLYYEQTDYLVETYLTDLMQKGFSDSGIISLARECQKKNARSWESLAKEAEKCYRGGHISDDSLDSYFKSAREADAALQGLLELAGLTRSVTSRDRDCYRTWTYSWGFTREMLEQAARISNGKMNPLPYMNAILAHWQEKGAKTPEEAEKLGAPIPEASAGNAAQKGFITRDYNKDGINKSLDDWEFED